MDPNDVRYCRDASKDQQMSMVKACMEKDSSVQLNLGLGLDFSASLRGFDSKSFPTCVTGSAT